MNRRAFLKRLAVIVPGSVVAASLPGWPRILAPPECQAVKLARGSTRTFDNFGIHKAAVWYRIGELMMEGLAEGLKMPQDEETIQKHKRLLVAYGYNLDRGRGANQCAS